MENYKDYPDIIWPPKDFDHYTDILRDYEYFSPSKGTFYRVTESYLRWNPKPKEYSVHFDLKNLKSGETQNVTGADLRGWIKKGSLVKKN